jgi:Trypsin-like peptidase domain
VEKLFAVLLLSSLALSQDASNHLVSVQHSITHWSVPLKIEEIQGSGICINRDCSVIATAAHTEMLLGEARLGIEGARTEKVLSAANESDSDKDKAEVPIRVSGLGKDTLSYNLANDIAFIYTRSAVHRKSGIPHSYKSYVGQEVRIAGYYKNRFTTVDAHIIAVNVPLWLGQGRLNENLVVDARMEPGSSGSAVLDEQGNLLGMITLCGAIKASSGDVTASVALTARTIAKALVKLDPVTTAVTFTDIPEVEPDSVRLSSANYQESELVDDAFPLIPELSAIPADVPDAVAVATLRAKAAAAGRAMVNIVAKQCLSQGKHKPICHELAVVEGEQTFRRISSKGKLGKSTRSFPGQTRGVWTQSDWTETLGEIADNPWVFRGYANEKYI